MREQWMPCVGFKSYYKVSERGNVWSIRAGRTLSLCLNTGGYPQVMFYVNGKARNCTTHRLVARAFLGPARGREVNHKNGKKTDNRYTNLEYLTKKQHTKHTRDVLQASKGERNGRARLTEEKVQDAKRRLQAGESGVSIARDLKVSKSTIYALKYGDNWGDTGSEVTRRGYARALTAPQETEARSRHAAGETVRSLACAFKVSIHTMYRLGLTCELRG